MAITLRQKYSAYAGSVGNVVVQQNDLIVVKFSAVDDPANNAPSDGFNTYSKVASGLSQ